MGAWYEWDENRTKKFDEAAIGYSGPFLYGLSGYDPNWEKRVNRPATFVPIAARFPPTEEDVPQ